jgi:ribosomal protein L7Ae-like RNA K-turn-binding protein
MNVSNDAISENEKVNTNRPPDPLEIYKMNLIQLKQASIAGVVVKGLKETLKAIESQKAKLVFIAVDNELEDYKKILTDFCSLYKKPLIEVNEWKELRDLLMDEIPSKILINRAKKKGKIAKITPKCYCAAIIENGDINSYIQSLERK